MFGNGGVDPLVLNPYIRWMWFMNPIHPSLLSRVKKPPAAYVKNRMLEYCYSRSGHVARRKDSSRVGNVTAVVLSSGLWPGDYTQYDILPPAEARVTSSVYYCYLSKTLQSTVFIFIICKVWYGEFHRNNALITRDYLWRFFFQIFIIISSLSEQPNAGQGRLDFWGF